MLVYICGPMTGYEDFNRPAFRAAAEKLRKLGFNVCSPDELDELDPTTDQTWSGYLRRDIPWVVQCGMAVVLPGWRQSKGATLEVTILRALGVPVFTLKDDGLVQLDPSDLPFPTHPAVVAVNAA